jgi:hypothetical protein
MDYLAAAPEPVKGEVVPRSLRKAFQAVYLAGMTFCAGSCCVSFWCLETVFGSHMSSSHFVPWFSLIFGLFGVLAGSWIVYFVLHRLLSRERLVIGKECFQIIHRKGGRDVVLLQIPYTNIVECRYEVHNQSGRIGIDLAIPDDSDTYTVGLNFESHKAVFGWHYTIEGGYTIGLIPIHKKLMKRIRRHGKEDAL